MQLAPDNVSRNTNIDARINNSSDKGREIYQERCYFCHGYNGDAKTVASRYLTPSPRNFRSLAADQLDRNRMLETVTEGRPETAMMGFSALLSDSDIEAVVDYIIEYFIDGSGPVTVYHSTENGWPDHQRYQQAFPYALGELAIDVDPETLSEPEHAGLVLFMTSCISCHEPVLKNTGLALWQPRAVSYPRGAYSHRQLPVDTVSGETAVVDTIAIDSLSGATPFAAHDQAPVLHGLSEQEKLGESLFQQNCAFCHAADGSGKGWIGSFLQPPPRDLTNPDAMAGMTPARLKQVIEEGLIGTTMSAWKSVLSEQEIAAIVSYIRRAFLPIKARQIKPKPVNN